jgi:hypothetical protein
MMGDKFRKKGGLARGKDLPCPGNESREKDAFGERKPHPANKKVNTACIHFS